MSDHFEKFVRSNREQFDQLEPKAELWDKLQQGLNQQAAAQAATQSAGSTASSSGASGLAKVGTIWKLAAAAVVIGITSTALYFGFSGDKKDGKVPTPSTASTTMVTPANEAALKPLVAPPIAHAAAAYNQFTVEVGKGGRFTLDNGTVLTVPANGFVTQDGAPVSGKVTLKYREFHDAADIMLSGIPMLYDEKGKSESGYFQTAGMIELLGEQDGQPVAIAPERPINVQMASFTEDDDYNLYFLDPQARGWKDIGKAKMSKRPQAKTVMVASDSDSTPMFADRKPINPKKVKPGTELTFAVDYTDFPELKPFKNLRWAASDEQELKKKEWIFTQVWTKIELEQIEGDEMSYRFKLKNKRRDATLLATPILEPGDYEKALASFNAKMKNHKSLEKQRKEEYSRRVAEANVLRTFNVIGFGIYNCDRILRMAKPRTVQCEFAVAEDLYIDPATQFFHLTGEFRAVIPIISNGRGAQPLTFSAAAKNYIVAVMPGGTLGVAGPEAFDKLDPTEQERTGKPFRIDLQNTGKTVTNAVELRDILGV
jgi:hypothetical protein